MNTDTPKTLFICKICHLEIIVDTKRSFSKNVKIHENCLTVRDPFKSKSNIIIGGKCENCNNCVCLSCSVFFKNIYCIECAYNWDYVFPIEIRNKIKKIRN